MTAIASGAIRRRTTGSSKKPRPERRTRRVYQHRAGRIERPREQEDGERPGGAVMRQERAQGDGHVGWHDRDDVLEEGQDREDRIHPCRRQGGEPAQDGVDQRRSSVATAIAAMPSRRPMNPIPSLVLPLTFTSPGASTERRGEARGHCAGVRADLRAPR